MSEPIIIERPGHKRECAGNLRISVTQGMTSGCVPCPGMDSKPIYFTMPECNCGATPVELRTKEEL